MRSTLIFLGILATVAACGTKGPLVMPPPKTEAGTTAPAVATPSADHSSKPAEAAK